MSEANFQVRRVLITRFLLGKLRDETEKGNENGQRHTQREGIVGKIMMVDGEVKRNDGGKTKVVKNCRNEEERVKVFQEFFDMKLTEEEIQGVKGRIVELKDH